MLYRVALYISVHVVVTHNHGVTTPPVVSPLKMMVPAETLDRRQGSTRSKRRQTKHVLGHWPGGIWRGLPAVLKTGKRRLRHE